MKRQHLEDNCESIDATVFSSDMLFCDDDRESLKDYIQRWQRAIYDHEGVPATIQVDRAEYEQLKAVLDAAINLRNVKGRHHSEIACEKLYSAIDAAIKQEGGE